MWFYHINTAERLFIWLKNENKINIHLFLLSKCNIKVNITIIITIIYIKCVKFKRSQNLGEKKIMSIFLAVFLAINIFSKEGFTENKISFNDVLPSYNDKTLKTCIPTFSSLEIFSLTERYTPFKQWNIFDIWIWYF